MEDQGTLTERSFVKFFMKIWERGRSVQSLCHTVLQVNERSTAATCGDFICTYHTNIHFLNCSVTGDKSLVFQYNLQLNLQRIERGTKSSPGHDKFRFQKSSIWMILITFCINRVWYTANQCWQINTDQFDYIFSCWKGYYVDLEWGHSSKRKAVDMFCMTVPLLLLLWQWRALLANHFVVEINHSAYTLDLTLGIVFVFLKWKLPSEEENLQMSRTLERI